MTYHSILPDASIVIFLHESNLWETFCRKTAVVVPSIIFDECKYYRDLETGESIPIPMSLYQSTGIINVPEASADDMIRFLAQFTSETRDALHPGEAEALSLMHAGLLPDTRLCCSDEVAVRALVLSGMRERGVSLAATLRGLHITPTVNIPEHLTDKVFSEWLERYQTWRIQGRGLVHDPFQR
jgi:hypothetical protein